MTRIDDLLGAGPTVSFEFFPPKTEPGHAQLAACLDELATLRPSFVSVTYGAGGSNRDATRDVSVGLDHARPYPVMPHLTCIGHRRDDVDALLSAYRVAGIRNVLALAGDPPADGSPAFGDFSFALELVEIVRAAGAFSVGVAAFPEGHPRSPTLSEDRRHLAAKLEAADFGITQFFYRAEDYLRMRDDLAALGCDRPVLPGIMPMVNPAAVRRFARMNGAWFPEDLAARVDAASPDDGLRIAAAAAIELCGTLVAEGVPGLHLYSLNRAQPSLDIIRAVFPDRMASAAR